MRKIAIAVAGAILTAIFACVPSLHPLYTDKDLIYDATLVGAWTNEDGTNKYSFIREGDKQYRLTTVDEQAKEGTFLVSMLKLSGATFLDLYPIDPKPDENGFYKVHYVPAHSFARITLDKDSLKVTFISPEWLASAVKANPNLVKHEIIEDHVVLTAATADLQKFVVDILNIKDAWPEPAVLKRLAPKAPKTGQ
ncbi:MAG: hypothetical protein NTX50_29250 [Candidatus Sumerlaeota bacterium]|nr:hypothetical protein [Candidatus Sumerlaeota bacterium]